MQFDAAGSLEAPSAPPQHGYLMPRDPQQGPENPLLHSSSFWFSTSSKAISRESFLSLPSQCMWQEHKSIKENMGKPRLATRSQIFGCAVKSDTRKPKKRRPCCLTVPEVTGFLQKRWTPPPYCVSCCQTGLDRSQRLCRLSVCCDGMLWAPPL